MKIALLYGSTHGRTRKVAQAVCEQLVSRPDLFDVKQRPKSETFGPYDVLLFFAPTYGDEELQDDMEDFLQSFHLDLTGRRFAVVELGNYYGYDDFSFGAMAIMRHHLLDLHGTEVCQPLSLDSLPKVHWGQLGRWVAHLNAQLKDHVGPHRTPAN